MRRSDCNREWLFDGIELEKTASRIDGLKSDEESAARAKAVWFLRDLGKVLGTKIFVIAAASVYFHRFFVFHSINKEKHDKLLVAAVCLFLAGKYEGCFNKVERVIAGYLYLRSRGRNISPEENLKEIQIQYQKLYNDPEKATEGREEKERLKSLFIEMEKSLLLTLCFELHVSHPHMAVAAHVSKMKMFLGNELALDSLKQDVYNTINDSYRSMLCLKYTSHEIAAAVVHFSTVRLSLVPTNIPEGSGVRTWSDILRTDVSEDVIQSICLELVQMYRSNPHQWANMALAKPEEQRRVEELLLLSYSPVAVTTSHSPYLTSFSSPLPSSHREAVVPTGGESSEDYPYGKELPKTQHQVTVTRVPRAASFSTSSQPAFHSEPSSAGSTPVPPPPPTPSTTNSEDAGAGGMFSPPPPPPESPFPMSSAIGSPYSMRPDMHVRSDSQCSMDSLPPPPPPSDTPRAFGAPSATTFKEERISRPRSDSGSSIDSFIPPPPPPLSQPLKRPRVD